MDKALKLCLGNFGIEDEEDQEECIKLIKQNDDSFALRLSKKRRRKLR